MGIAGFSGDGGPATAARLNKPYGIALDAAGAIYFADELNNRVRKIDTSGIITTIAGTGAAGALGDGGPATMAQLNAPFGVAADTAGNVYITDQGNQEIRKINTSGIISTFAGTGAAGYSGDGGPATDASINTPWGIFTQPDGVVYFSDHYNNRVRKIDPATGIITTVAGNGITGYSGDGGPATAANLNQPSGLTFNRQGNMYFSDWESCVIRKVAPANFIPYFNVSSTVSVVLCSGTAILDTLLSITDSDVSQAIHWSLVSPPSHGTASVACDATTTGGLLMPSATTYTPFAGYRGMDTFTVRVRDYYYAADTITVIVYDGPPTPGPIISPPYPATNVILVGTHKTLSDSYPGGVWSCSNGYATISATGVLYGTLGSRDTVFDTVSYAVSNSCGDSTVTMVFAVVFWGGVDPVTGVNNTLSIFPNPACGTFTINSSSPTDETAHITLTDITGKQVKEYTAATNKPLYLRPDMANGVYFIHVTTKQGVANGKIVIDR